LLTGIGISQEQQSRLFSSFEQAESNTTRKFGGTGLGLAISKKIVEMMDGNIWIDSEIGKGSTFSFTVKLERVFGKSREFLNPELNPQNINVLVIDDSREVREYFADMMDRFGIKCDIAGDGSEAIEMIKSKGHYDIYFVDWKMPGLDGIEVTKYIKNNEENKAVVIMISSTEWDFIKNEATSAGVDKFMPKPIFPSAVAECINNCIGGSIKTDDETTHKNEGIFKGYCMLLVDDVEINREIVIALLEPTGIEIECAENGIEAVNKFTGEPDKYDLIFMDVQMPEMDGYDATRTIRNSGVSKAKEVPIIAMTANVFKEDIEKCLASGMDEHIGKPLNFDEVLIMLHKYFIPRE